jgi:hypothetical protein
MKRIIHKNDADFSCHFYDKKNLCHCRSGINYENYCYQSEFVENRQDVQGISVKGS